MSGIKPQGLHKKNKLLLRLASLHKNEIVQQRNRYIINKAQNLPMIIQIWGFYYIKYCTENLFCEFFHLNWLLQTVIFDFVQMNT